MSGPWPPRTGSIDDWDDDLGDFDNDDRFEDPPLYPAGRLASMTLDELERESRRQEDREGMLGDAEHIDERAVEEAEMRYRMVDREIARRKGV